MKTALLLLPDFALIALGWWLGQRHFKERDFWSGLERLVYHVLFPALLFSSIAQANLRTPGLSGAVAIAVGVTLIGIVLSFIVTRLRLGPMLTAVSCAQCAYRFNSYIALALAARLYGEQGLAVTALITALVVPLANFSAVAMLARGAGRNLGRELLRNPLILATLGGFAFNFLGGDLPEPVWTVLKRLGAASLALGLITVGAGLTFSGVQHRALIGAMLGIKHFAMPLAALGLTIAFGLTGPAQGIAVMFAAYPTAASAYILAARMGGDSESVAATISLSTLIGMLTLPAWVAWLGA